MAWWSSPMLGVDVESTGTDVEQDRIIQTGLAQIVPGSAPIVSSTLINPGVPIPEGATAVHGITDEQVQAGGIDPVRALTVVADWMWDANQAGTPLVLMNAPFDLTMIDRECRRHSIQPPVDRWYAADPRRREERPPPEARNPMCPVIDIAVLDKWLDPYRPGSRRLDALCRTYGVKHEKAHDAVGDVLATCRIAWKMGYLTRRPDIELERMYGDRPRQMRSIMSRYRQLGKFELDQLHLKQIVWKWDQATGLERHFQEKEPDPAKRETITVDRHWPYRPMKEGQDEAGI